LPLSFSLAGEPEVPLSTGDAAQIDRDRLAVSQPLAEQITGGLSFPGKMPCPAWASPPRAARSGPSSPGRGGTVCNRGDALKGSFSFQTQKNHDAGYQAWTDFLYLDSPLPGEPVMLVSRWSPSRARCP
jgi:hypothetical protein